jgi:hypothetical protein
MTEVFTERAESLQGRLYEFVVQRKKLAALKNYQKCAPFVYGQFLKMIEKVMRDTLTGPEESRFLDHMLQKYELVYLDWAYVTKWLKGQMRTMRKKHGITKAEQMRLFVDYSKKMKVPIEVPTHLVARKSALSKHIKGGR